MRLDEKDYQYLYSEGDFCTLMDTETYEQIQVRTDLIGEPATFP